RGPHRLQVRTQLAPAEGVVGGLQLLRVVGGGPDHQVGVGAEATDVVETADLHADLGELHLDGVDVEDRRQPARGREDRVHRVEGLLVDGLEVDVGGVAGVSGRVAHADSFSWSGRAWQHDLAPRWVAVVAASASPRATAARASSWSTSIDTKAGWVPAVAARTNARSSSSAVAAASVSRS